MERGGLDHAAARCFLLSTTNGAEQSGLAASMATVDFYRSHDVIAQLERTGSAAAAAIRTRGGGGRRAGLLSTDGDFGCRPVTCLPRSRWQAFPAHPHALSSGAPGARRVHAVDLPVVPPRRGRARTNRRSVHAGRACVSPGHRAPLGRRAARRTSGQARDAPVQLGASGAGGAGGRVGPSRLER